jgi:hypothetical protein
MSMPNPFSGFYAFKSVVTAFREWAHQRKVIRQCRQQLDETSGDELARIAKDVGISPIELRQMAKLGPNAAKQLLNRMVALRLDPDVIAKTEPIMMRDLQRLCSACTSKKRCQRDLVRDRDDPMWQQYCPNAGTLDALQSGSA